MKTRNFVLLLLSLAVLAGCRKYDQPDNTYYANKQALDQMLQSEYENYLEKAPGYPGGLALNVHGNGYIASSPAGQTKDQRLDYRHHSGDRSNVPARRP